MAPSGLQSQQRRGNITKLKIGTGIVFVPPPLSPATADRRRLQKANIKELITKRLVRIFRSKFRVWKR